MHRFNQLMKGSSVKAVLAVIMMAVVFITPASFGMVAPDPPPPAPAAAPAEPAPAQETTGDQLVAQVETPAPAASPASSPDTGTSVEAPAFEAPASSDDLVAQFEF